MGSIGCWEGKVKLCYSEVLHTYWLRGRARWENKRLKIITYGPIPARFVHCDWEPNIFLFGLTKLSQEAFHYTSTNCWKFWKFCFQPKRAQWTGTQENLKRILQIWKLFLCFSKSEKETFPLSFCNKYVWVLGHKALPRQGQVNLLATLVSFHCDFLWIAHKGHCGSYVNHYFWTYGW